MNTTELSHRSRQHVEDSATRYELADISSHDYVPSEPFKALFCTTAGNLVIVGVDGVDSPVL
ncbi:hypothetical protein LXA11_17710, partial [Erwinia amylovora]|uniref:hypothetical protein n=1 Tax=Erwinia amylovora TaxID=552 RepID=UPI0020C10D28